MSFVTSSAIVGAGGVKRPRDIMDEHEFVETTDTFDDSTRFSTPVREKKEKNTCPPPLVRKGKHTWDVGRAFSRLSFTRVTSLSESEKKTDLVLEAERHLTTPERKPTNDVTPDAPEKDKNKVLKKRETLPTEKQSITSKLLCVTPDRPTYKGIPWAPMRAGWSLALTPVEGCGCGCWI